MTNYPKLKRIIWLATALIIIFASFAFSARFTSFFGATRLDKMIILGSSLFFCTIISVLVVRRITPGLMRTTSHRRFLLFAGLSTLLSAAVFLFHSTPPPFPENHSLEITILDSNGSLSHIREVRLISMERVSFPGGKHIRIDPSELSVAGGSNPQADNSILLTSEVPGSINYQSFMQAGIELIFKSGPWQGIVQVKWDGVEHIIDLHSYKPPSYTLKLLPAFELQKADTIRKLLVNGAMLAEFFSLAILLTIIGFSLSIFFGERVVINHLNLLVGSASILVFLLIFTIIVFRPVQFKDYNLESAIRETIENPDKPITRGQLKTIVTLDASNRDINYLDGIEELRNLSELDLRSNQISDLTPLGKLKHLKELNLRDNIIHDLSPISGNTSLVYLNLHSNPGIFSIEPLSALVNLETLILADVQVKQEIALIEQFTKLKHLNLRNCNISDVSPLANLANLEYLNLHSNPGINSIASLVGKFQLQTLILANVPIGDEIAYLTQFPSLKHLNLRNTGISDLTSLSGLFSLNFLNLHSNPGITSISPLASLTNLKTLIMENVPVGDQTVVLHNFPYLTQLNLRNTGITDTSTIAQLLAAGAFQDDLMNDLKSSIDIRDNRLEYKANDSYSPLRQYWENVSIRAPFVLPYHDSLHLPAFSHPAGFYTNSIRLKLSTNEPSSSIHFTLDGSEPTRNSPVYQNPILVESRKGEPNQLSEISDISPYWKIPVGEVFKATVVRAKVFHDLLDKNSSTLTHTYFVDEEIFERYSMPVISLTTNSENLFDYEDGIYVMGQIYDLFYRTQYENSLQKQEGNYSQHGAVWERPVHIELFGLGGQSVFSQNGSARINGKSSRSFPKKTLRIYANSAYDPNNTFNYEFIPGLLNRIDNQPIEEFENFLLHNASSYWDQTLIRDILMNNLVKHTALDIMAYYPVIMFLNGEYWGIHNLSQRPDENYLAAAYQIDPSKVVILEENNYLYYGNPGDEESYSAMLEYIARHDISANHNYKYIQSLMDVQNFIDYQVSEIYSANTDWPDNNVRYWRMKTVGFHPDAPPGQDGRWRWILFDTALGFGWDKEFGGYKHNTLANAQSLEKEGDLLYSLFQNESFKLQFINQLADHLNTSFQEQRVLESIDDIQSVFQPEMEEYIKRWRLMDDSIEVWEQNVEVLREFARNRPETVRQQIVEHFGLEGTAALTLITDAEQGYIQINSIPITTGTPGVENPENWSGVYFKGIPIQITAIPNPGYEFMDWQGLDSDQDQAAITLDQNGDLTLKANFAPVQ